MPPRAVNAFERLAPDQRAAVELVLRGRGYAELAGLLGIPEATVRERARGGLEALAPDLPPPARAGEIADWLLGQDGDVSLVAGDAAARRWAETVAAPLRELPGASVPALPPVAEPAPPVSPPPGAAASAPPVSPPPGAPPTAVTGRSSRRGGAVLIAAAVVVVGAVLAVVLTRGGHDGATAAGNAPPAATAAATGTPQAQPNDIVLRGPAGSKSVGLMRLIRANDNSVRFALAAQDVPPNTGKDTYSIWFRKKDGTALRLGVAQSPVGKDGTLTTAGPRNEDVAKFPQWFVSYDNVLVTRDSSPSAKQPGRVILSGDLPSASPSG
jgi:hypothetical protein